MIELREYQSDMVDGLSNGFKNHKRQIGQAATGAGKTVIFSEIVRRAAFKNTCTLILTNRIELCQQTFSALNRNNVSLQLISADNKSQLSTTATINLAMVETLKRRVIKGFQLSPKLIIIDECHIASFNSVIDMYPDARVIGFSATPLGKHIFKYYTNMVSAPNIPELIEMGFLCQYRAFEMQDDLSDLKKDTTGEYTDQSLFTHYNKKSLYDGVIDEYKKRINGLKTIVFCVNVEHTINTCKSFNDAGIMADYVTGETPKAERHRKFQMFKLGYITVLVNCGVAVFGYDEPSIQAVILNFATTSLAKFLQTIGRGGRIFPEKEFFYCLDFGKNHSAHGLWSQPRTWSIEEPKKKKSQGLGAAVIRKCPECEAINAGNAKVCIVCGHVFAVSELKTGEMREVTQGGKPLPQVPDALKGKHLRDLSIEEIKELQKSKKYSASFCWKLVRAKGKDAIYNYGAMSGYKREWCDQQIAEIENSVFKNFVLS